jgi:hypothetical protein
VQLLKGEAPTSADLKIRDNAAYLNMGSALEMSFASTLVAAPSIALRAATEPNQVELWRLDAAPLWHVELGGIPVVHGQSGGVWLPQWQPWPGETVSIAVTRPEAVDGPTLTVDSVRINVTPGLRATDVELSVALRSSQGGTHQIVLPESAQLLSVRINNVAQPLQAEGRTVRIPLTPGAQVVRIAWREARGLSLLFRTPEVDLGIAGVNANVVVNVPPDRWLIAAGGPPLGPAILFWGLLPVLLVVAWALARAHVGPLSWLGWALLGLGLTQSSLVGGLIIVGWFGVLTLRERAATRLSRYAFNALQIVIPLLTLAAAVVMLNAVREGLLGLPEMQVAGNGSTSSMLVWFADRFGAQIPQAWMVSVPIMIYRIAMLSWALWLAWALVRWVPWAWRSYASGSLWRPGPPRVKRGVGPAAESPTT